MITQTCKHYDKYQLENIENKGIENLTYDI